MTSSPRKTRSSVGAAQRSPSSWLYWLCIVMAVAALSPRIAQLLGSSNVIAASSKTIFASRHSEATKPRLVTKPIEEIRCGDRIASELPDSVQPDDQAEPDPATWRLAELELTKHSGDVVRIQLLRPLTWLAQSGALTEGTFRIQVDELDLEGQAAVLQILPCPPISTGTGQVVTGTFQHTCDSLVEVRIASQSEPIVCTTGHPIWSETRRDFVDAASLSAGEQVRTVGGKHSHVLFITIRTEPVPVFNIEVNRTHTYLVGSSGLLVHNTKECTVRKGSGPEVVKDKDGNVTGYWVESKNGTPILKRRIPNRLVTNPADDIPDRYKQVPYLGESGRAFAERVLRDFGEFNRDDTGPGSLFNRLKKFADRHFED